jgi:hypothetical protein
MNHLVVVGNGPSVVDDKKGELIDAHKEVVRMNEYYLYDRETTGLRTTIWATAKDFHHWTIYKSGKDFKVDWSEIHSIIYTNKVSTDRCNLVKAQAEKHNVKFVSVPQEQRESVIKRYKGDSKNKMGPSAGLMILSYYIECLKQSVDCIEFDGLDSYRMHYFDNAVRNYFHPPEREIIFINQWIKERMLTKI